MFDDWCFDLHRWMQSSTTRGLIGYTGCNRSAEQMWYWSRIWEWWNRKLWREQIAQTSKVVPRTKHLNSLSTLLGSRLTSLLVHNRPHTHCILYLFYSVAHTCTRLVQRCYLEAQCTRYCSWSFEQRSHQRESTDREKRRLFLMSHCTLRSSLPWGGFGYQRIGLHSRCRGCKFAYWSHRKTMVDSGDWRG